jgi:hypothetical protein
VAKHEVLGEEQIALVPQSTACCAEGDERVVRRQVDNHVKDVRVARDIEWSCVFALLRTVVRPALR